MKFLKLSSRLILFVGIVCLFNLNNYSQEATHTLTGSLVDSEKKPIIGVNIIVKSSHHGDISTITGADGAYILNIPDDGPLTIKYNKTGYIISPISYISGASNQNINRIMVNTTGEVEFNEADAEEIAKALQIYKSNPELYADELELYANTIKATRLPQKYRATLDEFEQVAKVKEVDRPSRYRRAITAGMGSKHTRNLVVTYLQANIPGHTNQKIVAGLLEEKKQTIIKVRISNPTEPLSEYYLIVKDKAGSVYHLDLKTTSTNSYYILSTTTSLPVKDLTLFISDDRLNNTYIFQPVPK